MCQAPKQFTIVPVPGTTTGGGVGTGTEAPAQQDGVEKDSTPF